MSYTVMRFFIFSLAPLATVASNERCVGNSLLQLDSADLGSQDVVHWGFTNGNATAIEEFQAWDLAQGPSADKELDLEAWPRLAAISKGWTWPGLTKPRVMVLSMPDKVIRRKRFRDMYTSLNLALGAEWFPAVVGKMIPAELRWLQGFVNNDTWDHDKPGNFGCFVSHLAMIRKSQFDCPGCDLVVFEDDAIFAPNFLSRFTAFVESLPSDWDILRIGGQSLWTPPFEYAEKYVRAHAYANTWGYVVRAKKVKRLGDLFAALPRKGTWGIDAIFQLFADELKTYAPTVPLVYTNSDCHDTAEDELHLQDCEDHTPSRLNMFERWPLGYYRSFCKAPGEPKDDARDHPLCKDPSSMACCPYVNPPLVTSRQASTYWQQQGTEILSAPRAGSNSSYFAVHIPRVAGTSFAADVRQFLPDGVGFLSAEKCWATMLKKRQMPGDHVVTFFREPRAHVLSHFAMCASSLPGNKVVPENQKHLLQDISTWLKRFDGGRNVDNPHCYNPVNMQTHAMSCTALDDEALHDARGDPKNRPAATELGSGPLELALANLNNTFFVGITEFYQESICVFQAKANPEGELPRFCSCSDQEAWSSFKPQWFDHHGQMLSDFSAAELQLVGAAVQDDLKLYAAAVERLERDIRDVEEARKVKIMCSALRPRSA